MSLGTNRLVVRGLILWVLAGAAYGTLRLTYGERPAYVHVRWSPTVDAATKEAIERAHGLTQGEVREGRTWGYYLTDLSTQNIRDLVGLSVVEDTHNIHRTAFRIGRFGVPRGTYQSSRPAWIASVLELLVPALLAIGALSVVLGLFNDWRTRLYARRHGNALNPMGTARVRRVLLTAGAIAAFVVLAGATYQGVATALERRKFPHPGRLVNVGGHQLHIRCVGDGTPLVVLEAPATGMSAAWNGVQPEVAQTTRVCSYDRAGLGWSEAGDRPYEPSEVAIELHALLEAADEPGPHVLAGQGLGAALATMYAARFGESVAGLVLIDPPAPEPASGRGPMIYVSPWLARTGILRVARTLSGNTAALPTGALAAFLNRPDHLTRAGVELSRWDDAVALASDTTLDQHIVVARVDAAGPGRAALLNDADQARKVTGAIRGVVEIVRRQ